MISLTGLPEEMLTRITTYLTHPTDLLALTKTCRELYETALKRLYHKVTIYESDSLDTLFAMLGKENAGVKHIRHLTLCLSPEYTQDAFGPRPIDPILLALAHLLDRNTLLTVSVEGRGALQSDGILALHKRQSNLQSARADDNSGLKRRRYDPRTGELNTYDIEARLVHNLGSFDLANVTSVHLYIKCRGSVLYSHRLLAACSSISRLDVDFEGHFSFGHDLKGALGRGTMGLESYDVMRIAFGHCLPTDWAEDDWAGAPPKPIRLPELKTLRLSGLDLEMASSTLLDAIDPVILTSLDCYCCFNVSALLTPPRAHSGPLLTHLKSLVVLAPPRPEYLTDNEAINTYHLVDLRGSPLAHTLQNIYYPILKQSRSTQLHYGSCTDLVEREVGAGKWTEGAFDHAMDIINKLPELNVLRILNLPTTDCLATELRNRTPDIYFLEGKILEMATYAFAKLRNASVLSIGRSMTHGSQIDVNFQMPPKFFVRDERVRLGGHRHVGAEEMSKREVQALEPESEIFDVEPERDCLPQRMWH